MTEEGARAQSKEVETIKGRSGKGEGETQAGARQKKEKCTWEEVVRMRTTFFRVERARSGKEAVA